MSVNEVDTYLAALDEPKRTTLEALRRTILDVIKDAEQGLSYGVPVFRQNGKNIAGFSAAKAHMSYFPHSGTVIADVAASLVDYQTSKGGLKFPVDKPLPKKIVKLLIAARKKELGM